MKYNFNGFTEKANEALNQAINSAEQLGHTYVGSEHLLLGLLRVGSGIAATLLNKNGITAENIENLMGVGKCVSADKYAFAAIRVMPPCFAMGQAAGTTAAMAIKNKTSICKVATQDVQNQIIKDGGYL
jgi:ATP-dependent Clp protease ATP-binding subunit ClpA